MQYVFLLSACDIYTILQYLKWRDSAISHGGLSVISGGMKQCCTPYLQ